ncbi:MAG: hypothetical protein LBI10_04390, partial [Deltaproteobacteria bacterium]|nr:hypothetical protein [Deltaproteobacteria bacterium]
IAGYEKLPIVAMTAHAMAGDREVSLEAGMNYHVTKPIDFKAFFKLLQNILAGTHDSQIVAPPG